MWGRLPQWLQKNNKKIFKKTIDSPGRLCYNKTILRKGGRKMEYFEIHGGEWEELQALLREEE